MLIQIQAEITAPIIYVKYPLILPPFLSQQQTDCGEFVSGVGGDQTRAQRRVNTGQKYPCWYLVIHIKLLLLSHYLIVCSRDSNARLRSSRRRDRLCEVNQPLDCRRCAILRWFTEAQLGQTEPEESLDRALHQMSPELTPTPHPHMSISALSLPI